MAISEWGPRDISLENRSLRVLDLGFSGMELRAIDREITRYLRNHPGFKVEQAIWHTTLITAQERRVDLALHIISQLAVVDRGSADVAYVEALLDNNSLVSIRPNNLDDKPLRHWYYQIDWIREPDQNPKSDFITAEQRAATEFRPIDYKDITYRWVKSVVIDIGRDLAERGIRKSVIKIELGPDGSAAILVRPIGAAINPDGTTKYVPVDRATGQYFDGSTYKDIRPEELQYLEVLAQRLEDKAAVYTPSPIDPKILQETYELAIRSNIILVRRRPKGEVEFWYMESLKNAGNKFVEIDLEQGAIRVSITSLVTQYTFTRPLNPQFVEFLKKKKDELERK